MMASRVREPQWLQLSAFIADSMGLDFPRERWNDLQRGAAGAAHEFGFQDTAACIDWLLAAPPSQEQLQVLASHLTIGETYFFRDEKILQAFTETILPEMIHARRGREQRLRIWSAACCSGEEPYTLAMLLCEAIPDLPDWQVTITATDINDGFLRQATLGSYGEWSFRNTPPWLKQRYFSRAADGRYLIDPGIRKLVNFERVNLVEDAYPSHATGTNAMDVIFCRNVLMYFTPLQTRKVVGNLQHALVDGGWLAVSPSEASHTLFSRFTTVNFPGAILYQKTSSALRPEQVSRPVPLVPTSEPAGLVGTSANLPMQAASSDEPEAIAPRDEQLRQLAVAELLYQDGCHAEAVEILLASFQQDGPCARAFPLLARALANQGNLVDALAWCDRWITADKLDPAGHYLRAVVLLEGGDPEQARLSLQRAIYLQPDLVLAHFALGNLARGAGKTLEAGKHFSNVKHLLRAYQSGDLLPESGGLTASRLAETLAATADMEPRHE